jgi:hypothetical protein
MQTLGEYVAFLAALSTVVIAAANWWYVQHGTRRAGSRALRGRGRG